MRQTMIIAAAALGIAAIWGTTVVRGRTPQGSAALASTAIDVMGMMKKAKSLPEEKFDAH
jgi:hypothetical protein